MTWPVFAVIQLALTLVGAIVVFCLHHRRIASENDALRQACEAAAGSASDADVSAQLQAQLDAIEGNDPAAQIQKLVLSHAISPNSEFAAQLSEHLGDPEVSQTWQNVRGIAWQQAAENESLRDVFTAYAPIDELLKFIPDPWPEGVAPEEAPDNSADDGVISAEDVDAMFGEEAAEESPPESSTEALDAEALLAENIALKEELEALKGNGSDADLRKLLKQFTQDSREMMGCIEQLEKENQALKAQLGQGEAA